MTCHANILEALFDDPNNYSFFFFFTISRASESKKTGAGKGKKGKGKPGGQGRSNNLAAKSGRKSGKKRIKI